MIDRRTLLRIAAASLFPTAAETARGRGAKRGDAPLQPNFIHICVDDMRSADYVHMPNLRALLRDPGLHFIRHFVPFALCAPSRVSILTGLQPHNHNVLKNKTKYGGYWAYQLLEANALPVWLTSAGYYVGHVGKFVNGYNEVAPDHVPPGYADWRAMSCSFAKFTNFTLNENGTQVAYDSGEYTTDVFVAKVLDFIASAPQPYAMFFWPNCCHWPAIPAAQDLGAFASIDMPIGASFNEDDVSDKPIYIRGLPVLSTKRIESVQEKWRRRGECLLALDRGIAALVEALTENGQLANTHIVFTSDNGFLEGEHRVVDDKNLLYEEAVKQPLYWRQPSNYGGVVTSPISNVDVTAAFVELAGAEAGRVLDGRSLVPLLSDIAAPWNRATLIQCSRAAGIATRYYRYAEWFDGEFELYDLSVDPLELANVAGDPAYADIQLSLATALHALEGCEGDSCSWTGIFPPPPAH